MPETSDDQPRPHRRFDPLTGRWIVVSPQRAQRPWQGAEEDTEHVDTPRFDPDCYLCPGNERVGGARNPDYDGTWWFHNDFPALLEEAGPAHDASAGSLLRAGDVTGTCRVLCFSPRHDLTLARMSADEIRPVVDLWAGQVAELGERYPSVQVFENRGEAMGASNPHPHGQLWATSVLPRRVANEDERQRDHHAEHGRPLLLDTLEQELTDGRRVVVANDAWVALVPWWATWPFEVLLQPREHVRRLPELDEAQRDGLADVLDRLTTRYDNLFRTSFPYSMGWHGAPTGPDAGDAAHWQLHAHVYPPLLRSASVRKFMVGFELLAEEQRDLTAEQAAERLAGLPDVHFLDEAHPSA